MSTPTDPETIPPAIRWPDPPEIPYPGLRPFRCDAEVDESVIFKGRERQVEDLLSRLDSSHLVAVVGPSGCGKSSLVLAGLIPALESGQIYSAGGDWEAVTVRPGLRPTDTLAAALSSVLTGRVDAEDAAVEKWSKALRDGHNALIDFHRVYERGTGGHKNLLLVVDQFEELFRDEVDPAEASRIVALILGVFQVKPRSLYVVLTMRTDYYEHCALYMGLPEALNRTQFLTPRLSKADLRSAIDEPARQYGGAVDRDLRDSIIEDMNDEIGYDPDRLPLMQHALMHMWNRAKAPGVRPSLSRKDFEEIGGADNALSTHAERIYAALGRARQETARIMFRLMGDMDEGGRVRRRFVTRREIEAFGGREKHVDAIVDAFGGPESGFIRSVQGPDEAWDVTHESFLRKWKRLRQLLTTEGRQKSEFIALCEAQAGYAASRRDLLGPNEIARYVTLETHWTADGPRTERYRAEIERTGSSAASALEFLDESRATRERDREDAAKRRRQGFWLVSGLLVISLVAAGYGWLQAGKARQEATKAEAAVTKWKEQRDVAKRAAEDALKQRDAAKRAAEDALEQKQLARNRSAHYFARMAMEEREEYPQRGLLLAAEAVSSTPVAFAVHTLRETLLATGGTILEGHAGDVLSIAYSPDGRRLATGSFDNRVRIWDLDEPGRAPKILEGHYDSVGHVAFDPAGRLLATAGVDATVRIWDTGRPDGEPTTLPDRDEAVLAIAFSDGGETLVSASPEQVVAWNLRDPSAPSKTTLWRRDSQAAEDSPWAVAATLSGDARRMVSLDANGGLWRWDIGSETATKAPVLLLDADLRMADGEIMALSPDGRLLAMVRAEPSDPSASGDAIAGSTVQVLDLESETVVPRILGGLPSQAYAVAFSPDGGRIAVAAYDNVARIWDLQAERREPTVLRGHENALRALAFRPDGFALATGAFDGSIRLWDTPRRVLHGHSAPVTAVAAAPAGELLLLSADAGGTVRVWRRAGASRATAAHDGAIRDIAIDPTGTLVATVADDGTKLWTLESLASADPQPVRVVQSRDGRPYTVAISPDGTKLVTGFEGAGLRIVPIDAEEQAPAQTLQNGETPFDIVYSGDGSTLVTMAWSPESKVTVWNLSGPQPISESLPAGTPEVNALAVHGRSKRLVTVHQDGSVRRYRLDSLGSEPVTLAGRADPDSRVAVSPDGTTVATMGIDGKLRLWDLERPSESPRVLHVHDFGGGSLAFLDGGRRLATAGDDGTVRLWDLRELLWRVPAEDLQALACARAGRNLTLREWTGLLTNEPYSKVCNEHPRDREFVERGLQLLRDRDIDAAVEYFSRSYRTDIADPARIASEVGRRVAPTLLAWAADKASEDSVPEALEAYERALSMSPGLSALENDHWAMICFYAGLQGHGKRLHHACDRMVEIWAEDEYDVALARMIRGVTRALALDLEGARADLESLRGSAEALDLVQEFTGVELDSLIETLSAGENPIDEDIVARLRDY